MLNAISINYLQNLQKKWIKNARIWNHLPDRHLQNCSSVLPVVVAQEGHVGQEQLFHLKKREVARVWCYWQRQWERWWWWWWSCRITNKTVVCLCIRPNMRTFDMKWRWIDGIPLLFLIEDFLGCVENIARWNSADNGLMGQLILRHLFPVWKLSSQKKVFFALIVLNCV